MTSASSLLPALHARAAIQQTTTTDPNNKGWLDRVSLADWIGVGVILLSAVAVVLGARQVVRALTARKIIQEYVGSLVLRIVTTIVVIIAVLYALQVLEVEVAPLLGGLTIFAVIIAYSLQPITGNLVGSIALHGSRPVKPGDQVETNGVTGTVIDIHPRATEILTFDGVTVHVPNLEVLGSALVNRTASFERRSTLQFHVGYEANIRQVQQVVEAAIRAVDGVSETPRADVLVTGFVDSGVELRARFWHMSEEIFSQWVFSEVAIAVQESLAADGISLSYPHRVQSFEDRDSET